jgi:outer membrane cobalamin receptor
MGAASIHAWAEEQPSESDSTVILEPVVVTATLTPVELTQVSSSVTVISREQIEATQARNITELLRPVPGVHIDQPGGRGSVSSVYLRGGDPNFTLVLLDGIKMNDPTNSRGGSFDFATLDIDNIERIEIVRGPVSVVHGADAVSGVINIITRRGSRRSAEDAEVWLGDSGYSRVLLQANGVHGKSDYALSISSTDDGDPVEGHGFRGKAFHANIGHVLSDNMEIRSTMRAADSSLESFPDDSGGPDFAVLRAVDERDIDELYLGVNYLHSPSNRWRYDIGLKSSDRREDVDSPGVAPGLRDPFGIPPNTSDNRYRHTSLIMRNRLMISERFQLAFGAELETEKGESDGALIIGGVPVPTGFDQRRDSNAAFIEVLHRFSTGLSLQAGIRVDRPEEFSSEESPRIGVAYTLPSSKKTLYASWGEGFKLPSFFALGNPIVGNPNLKPETSRSTEFGIRMPIGANGASTDISLFSSVINDAIDLVEGPPPILVNRSEITLRGFEAAITVKPSVQTDLSAQVSYVDTDIRGTKEELRNRPEWRASLVFGWRPHTFLDLQATLFYVGEVVDSSIPTGDRDLDDYLRADLVAIWRTGDKWRYMLAIDNLFDADYEEAIGFPAPGTRLRFGVRASF